MGVTISTHNGSSVAREHNIRNEKVVSKEEHIDPNGEHEVWVDEPVREAYHRLFDEAVERYNEKQTREDRKITNYFNEVNKDAKKHPVYEMIIGIYGKDENGVTVCDEKTGKEIMREFVDTWHERNPNLELIGAYYHNDEQGEPHVHIDYIPVAHGYIRGLDTQNGLVKALGEMGLEKHGKATAQIQWEARENAFLDKLCRDRGLEVEHPKEEGRQHLETQQYKAEKALGRALDHTKDLLDVQDDLRAETSRLEAQRDKANEQAQKALERKARAVKLHKEKDGDGFTYDRELASNIKKEVKSLKADVQEIEHTDLDVTVQYEQAEQLRQQQERALEDAKERREQAIKQGQREKDRLIAEGQKYKDDIEGYILGTAWNIAQRKFKEFIQREFHSDVPGGRESRLEAFCDDIRYKDGTTVLERFNKAEEDREQQLRDRWNDEWDDEWER